MTGSPFASARRAPSRWRRRGLAILAATVIVVALAWALAVGAVWAYAWAQLGGLELPAAQEEPGTALGSLGSQAPQDATTVLVVLTGPRDPTIPREPELVAPVALAQVGGGRDAPAVLLLPPELRVSVEGLGNVPLEEAHREGGEQLVARAVVDYSEVRIDHVVSVTSDALPELVAALGGVEACGSAGCEPLTEQDVREAQAEAEPEQLALALADTLRGIGQAVDVGTAIRSPLVAKRIIDTVADEVRTDVELRGTALLDLAARFAESGEPEVEQIPLLRNPGTGELVPLEEPAMVRFQRLREGASLGAAGDRESMEAMLTESVDVVVLNGAGVDGLAGQVQARLETAGFDVVGTGNAPTFDHASTVVAFGPEPVEVEGAAVVLAERLDDAQLQALDEPPLFEGEPVDVVVTVGEDLATEGG